MTFILTEENKAYLKNVLPVKNYAVRATQLRDERLKNDVSTRLPEVGLTKNKNKELFEIFQQFDGYEVGNQKLVADMVENIPVIRLVAKKAVINKFGVVFIEARYSYGCYQVLVYDVNNRHNFDKIGEYKSLDELMEVVVQEVSKL